MTAHGFNGEADLLGQIRNTFGWDLRMILHKEAVHGKEFKLASNPNCASSGLLFTKAVSEKLGLE